MRSRVAGAAACRLGVGPQSAETEAATILVDFGRADARARRPHATRSSAQQSPRVAISDFLIKINTIQREEPASACHWSCSLFATASKIGQPHFKFKFARAILPFLPDPNRIEPTNYSSDTFILPLRIVIAIAHQSRTPPAESRQHSDSDNQQVVAELLGAELSELLLGQALEAAKIRMTNHEPTCVAEEPASQSAQSSESQQPEERGRGASEPQLSNMPEFHRLRTNSEVERYSDQVAQLFTSLAGINETNEEQAADEPEVNAGDENGQSNDARMTTMSSEVDQANQDTSGDNQGSIVQPHTTSEQATSGTQQEEVVATGDCEPSATRKGELDELSRPKAVESRSPAADGETRQEDPSKTLSESPAEESSNECPYSASSLAAAPADKDTNRDRIGNEPDLAKARTSSADSTFSDSSSAELPEELARKEEHSSEEDSCCVSGCICGDEAEEFCGETASNSTLRRLKMNTFEDVLVCEQNRQSMAAARRLFGQLARAGETGEQTTGSKEIKKPKAGKWGGSLSSAEEPEEESDEMDEEEMRQSASSNKNTQSDNNSDGNDSEGLLKAFDTIKIVRRSGSSASSSNFRQTLVCSVSPTSQLGGSNLDMSVADTNHPIYPIDGEEIIQCRAAFRENKRLIEEQQERARNILADCSSSNKNRASSPLTGGTRNFRLNRTDPSYLDRSMKQSKCSRCQLRVYPVDRMELDFTRTTLNIHRNCFKCQICSTLLR